MDSPGYRGPSDGCEEKIAREKTDQGCIKLFLKDFTRQCKLTFIITMLLTLRQSLEAAPFSSWISMRID